MQSILGDTTKIEAISSDRSQNGFGAVVQQVNWLAIIENLYSILLLLLPVFFLPITADSLNLNKAYLTVLVALLALILFFADGIQKGKLTIFNPKAYLGLTALGIAAIISIFSSMNKVSSIFGHFGNYTDSLVFIISLVLIGFVASNVRLNLQKLLRFFSVGVTLSTLFSILVLYGVAIPGLGLLPKLFSLSGSIYYLMGLQVIVVLLSVYYLLASQSFQNKVAYTIVLIINAMYLIVLLNPTALVLLVVGLLSLFLWVHKEIPTNSKTLFIGILVVLGALTFVHHYPATREALGLKDLGTQPRLSLEDSWVIASETLRDRPIRGSGIGTFVNMFSLYRPATLNAGENWQARFETPYSDILLWIGSAGLIGLVAYLGFALFALNSVKVLQRRDEDSKLLTIVIPMSLMILILLGSNPLLYVLLFLALGVAIHKGSAKTWTIDSVAVLFIFLLISGGIAAYVTINAARIYAGQYAFRESMSRDNLGERFQLQAQAIESDMNESVYQRAYISTAVAIASVLGQKQDLTEQEKQEVVNILSQSFNNVRYITEVFEPYNVANWSLRGDLYASVIDVAEGADQLAVTAYRNAIQLEKTNPDLWINLGSVYYRRKVYAEAVSAYLQAVQLKPDYANARYNLAYALKDAGYYADAVTQMEVALRLVPEDSTDYQKAAKELEDFKKALADASAQQKSVPGEVAGASTMDDQTENAESSNEPLVAPDDRPATQVETTDEAVQTGINGIVEEEQVNGLPSADGSDVPEGGREAPIANPEGNNGEE